MMINKLSNSYNMVFRNEDGDVGSLNWDSGELLFEGKADEAARLFFEHLLKPYVDQYIVKELEQARQDRDNECQIKEAEKKILLEEVTKNAALQNELLKVKQSHEDTLHDCLTLKAELADLRGRMDGVKVVGALGPNAFFDRNLEAIHSAFNLLKKKDPKLTAAQDEIRQTIKKDAGKEEGG